MSSPRPFLARLAAATLFVLGCSSSDDALAPLSIAEREQFTRLAARVKGQLQSMAGAHGA